MIDIKAEVKNLWDNVLPGSYEPYERIESLCLRVREEERERAKPLIDAVKKLKEADITFEQKNSDMLLNNLNSAIESVIKVLAATNAQEKTVKKLILLAVIWVVTWTEQKAVRTGGTTSIIYLDNRLQTDDGCVIKNVQRRDEFDDEIKAIAWMTSLQGDGAKDVTLWKQEKVEEKK